MILEIIIYLCFINTGNSERNFIIKSLKHPQKVFYIKSNKKIILKPQKDISSKNNKKSLFIFEKIFDEFYYIKSSYKNKFLTLTKRKSKVRVKKNKYPEKILWNLKKVTDGYCFTSRGLCLQSNQNGKKIKTGNCNNDSNQVFTIEYYQSFEDNSQNFSKTRNIYL